MQVKPIALALAGLLVNGAHADSATAVLDEITVTATRIPTPDFVAPYVSEVHSREQIEQSGAATLYDYLARNSSLQIMPSYGNAFSQLLDMRGYGLESGYSSIVVVVDGQRLNNIDNTPQLLSAIPLASIERIEIAKGSGSVVFGDGAMAGVIQVHTRQQEGVDISAAVGNHGVRNGNLSAGLVRETVRIQVGIDYSRQDGFSDPDASGHRDSALSRSQTARLSVRPFERLWLHLEGSDAHVDARYINPITQAQYESRPETASGTYPRQIYDVGQGKLSADLNLAPGWDARLSYGREDKASTYRSPYWTSTYDYDRDSYELSVSHRAGVLETVVGAQANQATRAQPSDRTSKDNRGLFVQMQYQADDRLLLSAGARREAVEYRNVASVGAVLKDERTLNAWDVGANWLLNDATSLFGNYTHSFQTPDIDRFFAVDWMTGLTAFNGFIAPARANTLNLGVNRRWQGHRLKLAGFYADLKDEIYVDPATWLNTNIDESHKYGLELQDHWRLGEHLGLIANYAWTRAIIDREDTGLSVYDGKDLPGVPRHTLSLSLAWQATPRSALNLSTTWRSEAWAMSDFANAAAMKQDAYRRTDLSYRYRRGNWEWFAAIDNLFDQKNGIRASDGLKVYPVSFSRNWRVGVKADF